MTEKQILNEFYIRWVRKTEEYDDNNLSDIFDKFFSLFVIFNRLYSEIAKILIKEDPNIGRWSGFAKLRANAIREQKVITRPLLPNDKWCATIGVKMYCKQTQLNQLVFSTCHSELETIRSLIRNREFYFYEDYLTNSPLWNKDLEIYKKIGSKDIGAVLELIYQIRCNLFHGEKEYSQAQFPLLHSVNFILAIINQHIFDTLNEDNRF